MSITPLTEPCKSIHRRKSTENAEPFRYFIPTFYKPHYPPGKFYDGNDWYVISARSIFNDHHSDPAPVLHLTRAVNISSCMPMQESEHQPRLNLINPVKLHEMFRFDIISAPFERVRLNSRPKVKLVTFSSLLIMHYNCRYYGGIVSLTIMHNIKKKRDWDRTRYFFPNRKQETFCQILLFIIKHQFSCLFHWRFSVKRSGCNVHSIRRKHFLSLRRDRTRFRVLRIAQETIFPGRD